MADQTIEEFVTINSPCAEGTESLNDPARQGGSLLMKDAWTSSPHALWLIYQLSRTLGRGHVDFTQAKNTVGATRMHALVAGQTKERRGQHTAGETANYLALSLAAANDIRAEIANPHI